VGAFSSSAETSFSRPLFRNLMLGIGASLILFSIAFEIILLDHFHNHVTDDARKSVADISENLHSILEQQSFGMSMALQPVLADESTQRALKARDGKSLHEEWMPLFEQLRTTNAITHFTFFDTELVALARLHSQQRDDKVLRHIPSEAKRSQSMAWGIEIGNVGILVLRTVHPVFYKGELIGYVELGKKTHDVFSALHINLTSHFAIVIDKNNIDPAQWEEYSRAYKERIPWDALVDGAVVFTSRTTFPPKAHFDNVNFNLAYHEIVFDGKTWLDYVKPFYDGSGARIGDIYIIHDITSDKETFIRFALVSSTIGMVVLIMILGVVYGLLYRADKTLRLEEQKTLQSEERVKALAIQSKTVFWEIDPRGIFTFVSDIMDSLTGYTHDEIVGKMHFSDMYSKNEAQAFEERARWVFESKEPLVNKEDRFSTKDGKALWVLVNAIPLFSDTGDFLGYRGFVTDITKRKLAEEAQKEAHDRIQKIASRIPGAIYQFKLMPDGSSHFPFASAAIYSIYRVTPEEVRYDASKVFDVLHPEDLQGVIDSISLSAKTLKPWRHEYRVKFDDGEVRWLFGNALPQMEEGGAILWHGFIDDITERKMMEEELKALNELLDKRVEEEMQARIKVEKEQAVEREFLIQKSKLSSMGEMMGAIAHQWRQPLNALNLNIQNLDDDFADGIIDKVFIDEFIAKNKATILFMSKTIDDFRNFFKIDKAKQHFSIYEAIEETLSLQKAQFKNRNIVVDITGEDVKIEGFRGEFQQVILNIINNAKDAIVEKKITEGKIVIALSSSYLSIEDNAGGIDEAILDRVFEPYFTTKEQGEGTGIGLYMSKMIIEKNMGGTLRVENGSMGARFYIKFAC